jgi:hypothetical protein
MDSNRVSNTEKSDAGGFSVVPLTTLAPKDRGQTGTMSCQRHTCTALRSVQCRCGVRAGHSTTRIVEATDGGWMPPRFVKPPAAQKNNSFFVQKSVKMRKSIGSKLIEFWFIFLP